MLLTMKKLFICLLLIIPSGFFLFLAGKLAYSAATDKGNVLLIIPAYWVLWFALIFLSFLFYQARNGFSKINDLVLHTTLHKKVFFFLFLPTEIIWAIYFSSAKGMASFAQGLLKHPVFFMSGIFISAAIFFIMLITLADLSYLLKKAGVIKNFPSFYIVSHVLLSLSVIWIGSLVVPFFLYCKATKKSLEMKSKKCSRCNQLNNPDFKYCWKCGQDIFS